MRFQYPSIIQILHEINFGDPRNPITTVFATLGALKSINLADFSLFKSATIHENPKSEPFNVLKWQILHIYVDPKIDFT